MRYQITYRRNGSTDKSRNMEWALRLCRLTLNADRVYKGAEYQTDRPAAGDDREPCNALDIWISRSRAKAESNVAADAVITWKASR